LVKLRNPALERASAAITASTHRHRSPDRCLPTGSSKDLDTAKAEFKAAWGRKARPEQLAAAYRDLNIRDDG
jgi:hypothetical protein